MQEKCINIHQWHDAGWTGLGINVWNMENYEGWHGRATTRHIKEAAPDVNVITLTPKNNIKGYGSIEDFIQEENINICVDSINGLNDPKSEKLYNNLKEEYNLILFNAADNNNETNNEAFMTVGEALNDYASNVDFSMFAGSDLKGASFSASYLAGLAAVILQRYPGMSHYEVYQYLKMITTSTETVTNIPVLPSIDKKLLVLSINSKHYQSDGENKVTDVSPIIKNGTIFVPVSFIAHELGAKVLWNGQKHEAVIYKTHMILSITIGQQEYAMNGTQHIMNNAPFIKNKRTFVPLSLIPKLECKVVPVPESGKILILEQ